MKLLIDSPELSAENLNFDTSVMADGLAEVILSTPPQFNLAVYGEWGTGKTTLLKQIKKRLADHDGRTYLTIDYQAWAYQHHPIPGLPLLNVIQKALYESLGKDKKDQLDDEKDTPSGTSVSEKLAIDENQEGLFNNIINYLKSKKVATLNTMISYLGGAPGNSPIDLFQVAFSGMISELESLSFDENDPIIVVFIDDLDRCPPPFIVETLDSLKSFLNKKGLIFIIAVDKKVVLRSLKTKYAEADEPEADQYLRKIIQVSWTLPKRAAKDCSAFAESKLDQLLKSNSLSKTQLNLGDAAHLLGHWERNPRACVELLNEIALRHAVFNISDWGAAIAWVLVVRKWPNFASILERSMDQIPDADNKRAFSVIVNSHLVEMLRTQDPNILPPDKQSELQKAIKNCGLPHDILDTLYEAGTIDLGRYLTENKNRLTDLDPLISKFRDSSITPSIKNTEKVRLNQFGTFLTYLPVYYSDFFRKSSDSSELQAFNSCGTDSMTHTATNSGSRTELQIGLGDPADLFSKLSDCKAFATVVHRPALWAVPLSSEIEESARDVSNWKGWKILTYQPGSTAYSMTLALLSDHGLGESDVNTITYPPHSTIHRWEEEKPEIIIVQEPFASLLSMKLESGTPIPFWDLKDVTMCFSALYTHKDNFKDARRLNILRECANSLQDTLIKIRQLQLEASKDRMDDLLRLWGERSARTEYEDADADVIRAAILNLASCFPADIKPIGRDMESVARLRNIKIERSVADVIFEVLD